MASEGGDGTPKTAPPVGDSRPPGGYSRPVERGDSRPEDGDEDEEDAYEEDPAETSEIPAAETIGPGSARSGTAVLEPPRQKRPAKPPAEWGIPEPSKIRESVSFPVVARYLFDAWRARYPMYQGTYTDFVLGLFMVGCRRVGVWPAAIWTEPDSDPPPGVVWPAFDGANIDMVFEGMGLLEPSGAV